MWSDRLVFYDCGFSLSALWCPLSAPTVLLGFLLPWMWGISSWLLQQSTAAAPCVGCGVSPLGRPLLQHCAATVPALHMPNSDLNWRKLKKLGKTTRPFRYDLNQIPYDYTLEVTNRFKGLDLIECLINCGQRVVTLYRRQGSTPSPRKRNAK